MALLNRETELYELFGETGTCAICQEDLVEGERTRAIRKCQHLFHPPCIEAWLKQKAECPMCRTVLSQGDDELMVEQIGILQVNLQEVQSILDEIRAVHRVVVTETDRYILSFCLSDGILKQFPSAFTFNNSRNQILGIMNGFSQNGLAPAPIDFTSRSALSRASDLFKNEVCERLALGDDVDIRMFRRANRIEEMRMQLSNNLAIRPIWAS